MSNKQFLSLYQETVLQHNKNPKNFGKMESPCHCFSGQNKMCGDYLDIYLSLNFLKDKQTQIVNISFEGQGCAILIASASMMTQLVKGKLILESQELILEFHRLISGELNYSKNLQELNIFSGISVFQSRLQCAKLPWNTLLEGLSKCI